MKTTIHLVRHGEVHNPQQIFYGRIPGYVLSENGIQQVHRLGKHLQHNKIKKIYASPLDRTKQTAQIIAEYFPEIKIVHDERLIEVGSPTEGQLLHTLSGHNFNFYHDKYRGNGETINDIVERMTRAIDEFATIHTGEEIIAVSHGDPIMITRTHYGRKEKVEFAHLRSDAYIETAHGITLTFEHDTVTVSDIIPV